MVDVCLKCCTDISICLPRGLLELYIVFMVAVLPRDPGQNHGQKPSWKPDKTSAQTYGGQTLLTGGGGFWLVYVQVPLVFVELQGGLLDVCLIVVVSLHDVWVMSVCLPIFLGLLRLSWHMFYCTGVSRRVWNICLWSGLTLKSW